MVQTFRAGRETERNARFDHLSDQVFECERELVGSEELSGEGAFVVDLEGSDCTTSARFIHRKSDNHLDDTAIGIEGRTHSFVRNSDRCRGDRNHGCPVFQRCGI